MNKKITIKTQEITMQVNKEVIVQVNKELIVEVSNLLEEKILKRK